MPQIEPRITKRPARAARRCGARRMRLGRNKDGRRRLRKPHGNGKCEHRRRDASLRRPIRPASRPRATCRYRHTTNPVGGGRALTTGLRAVRALRFITITCPNGWPLWVLRAVRFPRPLGRCARSGSERHRLFLTRQRLYPWYFLIYGEWEP